MVNVLVMAARDRAAPERDVCVVYDARLGWGNKDRLPIFWRIRVTNAAVNALRWHAAPEYDPVQPFNIMPPLPLATDAERRRPARIRERPRPGRSGYRAWHARALRETMALERRHYDLDRKRLAKHRCQLDLERLTIAERGDLLAGVVLNMERARFEQIVRHKHATEIMLAVARGARPLDTAWEEKWRWTEYFRLQAALYGPRPVLEWNEGRRGRGRKALSYAHGN